MKNKQSIWIEILEGEGWEEIRKGRRKEKERKGWEKEVSYSEKSVSKLQEISPLCINIKCEKK